MSVEFDSFLESPLREFVESPLRERLKRRLIPGLQAVWVNAGGTNPGFIDPSPYDFIQPTDPNSFSFRTVGFNPPGDFTRFRTVAESADKKTWTLGLGSGFPLQWVGNYANFCSANLSRQWTAQGKMKLVGPVFGLVTTHRRLTTTNGVLDLESVSSLNLAAGQEEILIPPAGESIQYGGGVVFWPGLISATELPPLPMAVNILL